MEDNRGNYYMNESSDNGEFKIQRWATAKAGNAPVYNPGNRSFGQFVGNRFAGLSTDTKAATRIDNWDAYNNENLTNEQILAKYQKNKERLGNAVINNLATLGSTLVSNIIGMPLGLLEAIAAGELNKLYTNEITQGAQDYIESSLRANPNYRRKEYEEKGALQRIFSTEFWADNIQSLGFTEGTLISSLIPGLALAKLPRAIITIASSLYSSLGEGSIEALMAKRDKVALETQLATDEYNKLYRNALSLPPAEQTAALQSLEDNFGKTLQNIEEDGDHVGNINLGLNIALLTATGAAEFGPLISRGMQTVRRASAKKALQKGLNAGDVMKQGLAKTASTGSKKSAVEMVTEGGKRVVKPALSKSEKVALETAKWLGRGSVEGFEEGAQGIFPKTLDKIEDLNSFNSSEFNPEVRELTNSSLTALSQAITEQLNDPNAMTEVVSGFVTGLFGSPMFRSYKSIDGKFQSPVYMQGATYEFLEEMRNYKKMQNSIDIINKRMEDPKFLEFYKALVRKNNFQQQMNAAIINDDTKTLKDYELYSILSDAILFNNVGGLNSYKQLLQEYSTLSDEDINQLIKETTDKNGNGPFSNNGNAESVENVKKKIKENTDFIFKQLDRLEQQSKFFDSKYPNAPQGVKEQFVTGMLAIQNWKERQAEIYDDIYEFYKKCWESEHSFEGENTPEEELLTKEQLFKLSDKELTKTLNSLIERSKNIEINEIAGINQKAMDAVEIEHSIENFEKQIQDLLKSPQAAAEKTAKLQEQAMQQQAETVQNKRIESLKTASSLKEFNELLNTESDDIDIRNVDTPTAKEYRKIQERIKAVYSMINFNRKEGTQAAKDLQSILNKVYDTINSVDELTEANTKLFNVNNLDNVENQSEEVKKKRLEEARTFFAQIKIKDTTFLSRDDMSLEIKQYERQLAEQEAPGPTLDDKTWNDLVLEEKESETPLSSDERVATPSVTVPAKTSNSKLENKKEQPEIKKGKVTKPKETSQQTTVTKPEEASDIPQGSLDSAIEIVSNDKGEVVEESGVGNPKAINNYVEQPPTNIDNVKSVAEKSKDNVVSTDFTPAAYQYDLTEANPINVKESRGNNKKYKSIVFKKSDNLDAQNTDNYLTTYGPGVNHSAWEWTNSGEFKKYLDAGGKVYIGIDERYSTTQPVFFVKIEDQYYPINVSFVNPTIISNKGLTEIHNLTEQNYKVLKEQNKDENRTIYVLNSATFSAKLNGGRIPLTLNSRFKITDVVNAEQIENLKVSIEDIGKAYILVKDANDKYLPALIYSSTVKEALENGDTSELVTTIKEKISDLSKAVATYLHIDPNNTAEKEAASQLIFTIKNDLNQYVNLQDLVFVTAKNAIGVREVNRKDGKPIIKVNEEGKTAYSTSKIFDFRASETAEKTAEDFNNILLELFSNLRFKVPKNIEQRNDLKKVILGSGLFSVGTPSLQIGQAYPVLRLNRNTVPKSPIPQPTALIKSVEAKRATEDSKPSEVKPKRKLSGKQVLNNNKRQVRNTESADETRTQAIAKYRAENSTAENLTDDEIAMLLNCE